MIVISKFKQFIEQMNASILGSGDTYAPEDARIPKIIMPLQKRNISKSKKKKISKK